MFSAQMFNVQMLSAQMFNAQMFSAQMFSTQMFSAQMFSAQIGVNDDVSWLLAGAQNNQLVLSINWLDQNSWMHPTQKDMMAWCHSPQMQLSH